MDLSRFQIRTLLLYEFRQGHDAKTATHNICHTMGDSTLSYATAKIWFRHFKNGNYDLEDKPHTGRPIDIDIERLQQLIEADPRLTTRQLAEELGCVHGTIEKHLHELGKVSKYGVWIPHELSLNQLQFRVDACQHLLTMKPNFEWLKQLVTGDEKWVMFVNHTRKRQWLSAGEKGLPVPKSECHSHKIMLSCWWNVKGVVHWELLPEGSTVTAELYSEQLDRLASKLSRLQDRVYFLHDNARPHTATRVRQKLQELGWILLVHPPYSPDLAPTDYHLFRSLSAHLKDKKFDCKDDLQTDLANFFKSKSSDFYADGIMALPSRWQQVVNNGGTYLS